MNLFLPGYSFGTRMAVVARSEEIYTELLERGADVMFISDTFILFQPGNLKYDSTYVKQDRLSLLCDFDIVEISDTGLLYRAFANNESDSTVFLGARCNSNCIMCPAGDTERRKGFSYSREQLMKYIDYLPTDLEFLVITGGEPTMQKELFLETLDRIRDKFPVTQVLLLTNGRSLSDYQLFRRTMACRPKRFRIAIPIHGATAVLHDAITRAPGSFDQTMLAMKRLMGTDIQVEVRIVVTKVNCGDLLNIAKLITAQFHHVHCVNLIGLEPRGNCALHFTEVYISHRDSFLCSKPAIEHLVSNGYDVGLYNYPLCAIDRDFWPIAARSISGYKNVYHPDCEKCAVRSICGGFFAAAMGIVKPQVTPVPAKEETGEESF